MQHAIPGQRNKNINYTLHPKVLHSPWKMVVGWLLSYLEGKFSEAMLDFRRVRRFIDVNHQEMDASKDLGVSFLWMGRSPLTLGPVLHRGWSLTKALQLGWGGKGSFFRFTTNRTMDRKIWVRESFFCIGHIWIWMKLYCAVYYILYLYWTVFFNHKLLMYLRIFGHVDPQRRTHTDTCKYMYIGCGPLPITVTTRIITF